MRFIQGFLVGGIIVGALAFAAGYNDGRGAPIASNPFGEPTLGQKLQDAEQDGKKAVKDLLDEATGN